MLSKTFENLCESLKRGILVFALSAVASICFQVTVQGQDTASLVTHETQNSRLMRVAKGNNGDVGSSKFQQSVSRVAPYESLFAPLRSQLVLALPELEDFDPVFNRLNLKALNDRERVLLRESLLLFALDADCQVAIERWAKICIEDLKKDLRPGNDIAQTIANYFMSQQRWQEAIEVLKLWKPFTLCPNWDVLPEEMKFGMIAICQLQQSQFPLAVQTVAEGLMETRGTPSMLPFLLFHLYDQAEQLSEFEKIIAKWGADGILSTNMQGDPLGKEIELLNHRRNVRSVFEVRQLSAKRDAEILFRICSNNNRDCFEERNAWRPVLFQVHESVYLEAAKKLASLGDEGVDLIQQHCVHSTTALSDWFLVSLLINPSEKSHAWLLELGNHPSFQHNSSMGSGLSGGDGTKPTFPFDKQSFIFALDFIGPKGKAIDRPTFWPGVERKLMLTSPNWPAPAHGSLPKTIELPKKRIQ